MSNRQLLIGVLLAAFANPLAIDLIAWIRATLGALDPSTRCGLWLVVILAILFLWPQPSAKSEG